MVMRFPREKNTYKPLWVTVAGVFVAGIVVSALVATKAEDFMVSLGLVKVAISFVKYLPQAILNCQRKSTFGFSLENVLLDLSGGILSFLQIYVDYLEKGVVPKLDSHLNMAKFLLGIVSIGFDAFFLFQHFYLYRGCQMMPTRNEDEDMISLSGNPQVKVEWERGNSQELVDKEAGMIRGNGERKIDLDI